VKSGIWPFIGSLGLHEAPNPYTQRKLNEPRDLAPRDEPFTGMNVSFHKTYTRLVEQVLAQLGESVPVVVLTGDNAKLLFEGGA